MAPQSAAVASAAASLLTKDLGRTLRWLKAFSAVKGQPTAGSCASGAAVVDPVDPHKVHYKGRYTNFSLQHIWEKYDYLQTHLLLRECVLAQIGQNPRLVDSEINACVTPTLFMNLPGGGSGPSSALLAEGGAGITTAARPAAAPGHISSGKESDKIKTH